MIESLSIKNFQSLYDVDVPLSPFTVLVGPSSVGKSAFVRAMRLLLQNARGSGFISHGEDTTTVAADFGEHRLVQIRRGKTNEYVLYPGAGHGSQHFTKLGGDVPDEVKNFIGIDPDISVAAQFDPPFLLTASGAEVARTLGSLTNVEVVLSAGREANRRKLAAGADLRALQAALDDDRAALSKFEGLDERVVQIAAAESALQEVVEVEASLVAVAELQQVIAEKIMILQGLPVIEVPETRELFQQVEAAIEAEMTAEFLLQEVDQHLLRIEALEADLVEVPVVDLDDVAAAAAEVEAAEVLQEVIGLRLSTFKEATETLAICTQEIEVLREHYSVLLKQAGQCPTCGQEIDQHADHALPA